MTKATTAANRGFEPILWAAGIFRELVNFDYQHFGSTQQWLD
jgi:hypothetical protein